MLRKMMVLATVLALTLCVGCASNAASSAGSSSNAASSSASASSASSEQSSSSSASAQMPNPWSDSADAQATAEGAGLESFIVPESMELSAGTMAVQQYRFMDGIAEADASVTAPDADQASARFIVRKGTAGDEGDISGDYNQYANEWAQTVGDIEVTCFGNQEGAASKIIWSAEDLHFSVVLASNEGTDPLFLDAVDIEALVQNIG